MRRRLHLSEVLLTFNCGVLLQMIVNISRCHLHADQQNLKGLSRFFALTGLADIRLYN